MKKTRTLSSYQQKRDARKSSGNNLDLLEMEEQPLRTIQDAYYNQKPTYKASSFIDVSDAPYSGSGFKKRQMSVDNFRESEIQGIIAGTVTKVTELLKSTGSLNNSRRSEKSNSKAKPYRDNSDEKKFSFDCVNLISSRNESLH